MKKNNIKNITLESTLKSLDTEEYIDLKFYRPIGFRWALFFDNLGITPNVVTIMAIFIGIAAGICFYFDNFFYNITGMVLLIWANSFDSADGQLARMTGQFSRLGRILDGACGDIWFITIYLALIFRLTDAGWNPYSVWFLAASAGYFHAKQASIADYYRNLHLFFLKGKTGSELDDSSFIEKKVSNLSWKKDFMQKLIYTFYSSYTKDQEKVTPNLQKFRVNLKTKYGDSVPSWLAQEFRDKSKPLMKYTNMLSFNTRIIILFLGLILNEVWIYFVFELTVLNFMLFYMIIRHENICRYFNNKIGA